MAIEESKKTVTLSWGLIAGYHVVMFTVFGFIVTIMNNIKETAVLKQRSDKRYERTMEAIKELTTSVKVIEDTNRKDEEN